MPDTIPDGASNAISTADVTHMADLARLALGDEERDRFARQFRDILGYMDVLAKVDTQDVPPLYSPALHTSQGRDDVALPLRSRDEVLANAPAMQEGAFNVPLIV